MTERQRMSEKPGSHATYERGPDLVVEWYDFGDHAPYESANLLIFDPVAQAELSKSLGLVVPCLTRELARTVARRFSSYFEVRGFADAQGIRYRQAVDFSP